MARPMQTGRQRGFTLLGLLFLIAGLGVAMAATGTLWQTVAQHEKEKELLFIGEQFSIALERYRRALPEAPRPHPPSLEVLLADDRFPGTRRHLRRIWHDPMTGGLDWGLVRDEHGGIIAIHSLSPGEPMKKSGFGTGQESFAQATTYHDWAFRARAAAPSTVDDAQENGVGRQPTTR